MTSLDNPSIEGFQPVYAYRGFDGEHLELTGPAGVKLDLTGQGVETVGQHPEIAALLGRTGVFIADHDGYRGVRAIAAFEPNRTLRVGEAEPYRIDRWHRSSVYRPAAVPDVIIKAYDHDQFGAPLQFRLGSWLHDRLAERTESLRSPLHLAMFTAPKSHHHTVLSEFVHGRELVNVKRELAQSHGEAAATGAADELYDSIREKLRKSLGRQASRLVVNDLHYKNLLVTAGPELTPEDLPSQTANIIDQPVTRLRTVALFTGVKLTSMLGHPLRYIHRPVGRRTEASPSV